MQKIRLTFIVLAITLLNGCSSLEFPGVYRINVGQGNIMTQEMVGKLRVGMTPAQVKYVMGTPIIEDTFQPGRWDYVYNFESGSGAFAQNYLTLYFESDRLARIDKSRYTDPDKVKANLKEQEAGTIPKQKRPKP